MNVLEHYVLEVIGKPYFAYNHWFVKVSCECYGVRSTTKVMLETEDDALKVSKGYTFMA